VIAFTFRTTWSEEDGEWVGSCDKFPSLSHLSKYRSIAMIGILRLVADVLVDEFVADEVPS
jgi:hypothetical protein